MAGGKEELHIFDLRKEVGFNSCSSISDSSCDANTPRSHGSRGSGVQTKRSSQAGWTEEEDTMLTDVVKKYNGRNWKKIAESVPGRSDVQCLHRWQKVLNPELVKGPWTKQEDDHIRELVEKHGCKKWSLIAKHLTGRIGKQCRERWHNHLDPAIKKDAWTEEEESTLAYYHQIYGNRWAEIARFLPGRTDNAIKNHWNSSKRRLDLNMPPTIPIRSASPEFSKKRNRGILFTEQKTDEKKLVTQTNTCSTNLALGNSKSSITDNDYLGFARYAKFHKVEQSTSPDAPMSSLTMFETPKKSRVDSVNDMKLGNSPDNSFLSLSTFGISDPNSQMSEKRHGSLCYQPPQLRNLAISLENGGYPSTGNSTKELNGPFSCSTPPDLSLSISFNSSSPESILRNSAMSYKNTPSIIRKRTPKKDVDFSTPDQKQMSHDSSKNVEASDSEKEKRVSDSWMHRSQPSLGRRLEYVFDAEWDPTMVRCCTPGSVTPSSKAKILTP